MIFALAALVAFLLAWLWRQQLHLDSTRRDVAELQSTLVQQIAINRAQQRVNREVAQILDATGEGPTWVGPDGVRRRGCG